MAPVSSDQIGRKYPEPIRDGETIRGVAVECRNRNGRGGPSRVMDIQVAGGEVRSVFEDNSNYGLFDTQDGPGNFVEVTSIPGSGRAQAPAQSGGGGAWGKRSPAVAQAAQGGSKRRTWEFTIWMARSEAAPAWATPELREIARVTTGLEKLPGDTQGTLPLATNGTKKKRGAPADRTDEYQGAE